jgi:hypothetical protein
VLGAGGTGRPRNGTLWSPDFFNLIVTAIAGDDDFRVAGAASILGRRSTALHGFNPSA